MHQRRHAGRIGRSPRVFEAQHPIEADAQSKNIDARISFAAANNFRSHVLGRSRSVTWLAVLGFVGNR